MRFLQGVFGGHGVPLEGIIQANAHVLIGQVSYLVKKLFSENCLLTISKHHIDFVMVPVLSALAGHSVPPA